jgi:hypothetical protein
MASFLLTKSISAPPPAVFAAVSDFVNLPSRIPAITKLEVLTPGPVGVGTRFAETRMLFGKEATETFEVVDFEPPAKLELVAHSCGAEYRALHRFVPEGAGTRLELELTIRPVSFFARLMTPLSWLMIGSMKKAIARDLDALAASVERSTGG